MNESSRKGEALQIKQLMTHMLPDSIYIKLRYYTTFGKTLNLKNPLTFNEKLQWLKLHDRNPLYTKLVDKSLVKEWVADKIGGQYIVKTYASWNRAGDVDVSSLPSSFVLKTNHDSSGSIICFNKEIFNEEAAKKELKQRLHFNYYWNGREWPYKNVERKVIAEECLTPNPSVDLPDYKVFCFNGHADCAMVCLGRASGNTRFVFVDRDWGLRRYNVSSLELPEDFELPKPKNADLMFTLAERLSRGIPFVRVDLYNVDGHVFFGEMTFYPQSGFDKNILPEADRRWGDMLNLDGVKGRLREGGSE